MNEAQRTLKKMSVIALVSFCLAAGNLPAQGTRTAPETILNQEGIIFSGYGGPVAKFTQINGDLSILSGIRGGVIINDCFVLGAAGYGLVYPLMTSMVDGLGYGGLLLEYHFFPKSILNFSAGIMAGAGGAGKNGEGNSFFVVEPELNAYANITRFMRFGVGASYRYSNGLELENFSDEDFRGFSGSAVFEFGWF